MGIITDTVLFIVCCETYGRIPIKHFLLVRNPKESQKVVLISRYRLNIGLCIGVNSYTISLTHWVNLSDSSSFGFG